MNKFKILLIATALMLTSGVAMAQKTGYISVEQVLQIMPEVSKLDSLMGSFQADSLNPQFAYLIQEYNRKDSILRKDSVEKKLTPTVKRQIGQEMADIENQVQNWQSYAQQIMQAKQSQLLEPHYRKAYTAIQQVAKDNGYTYVYSREALLVGPPADDLLPLVAKKLNLKLPTTYTPGFRYQ